MSKEKKILLFSNWYPNRVKPFQGDFVQRHARAIALKNRVQVVHFVGDEISKTTVIEREEGEYLREKIIYFPNSQFRWLNSLKKSYFLIRELRNHKDFDLVHLNVMYYHFWPLVFSKKPMVVTEHFTAFLPENVKERFNGFQRWIFKNIYEKAKKVMPVCERLGTGIQYIAPRAAIKVVPNVVNTEVFRAKSPHNTAENCTFLHVSNLSYAKNIPTILTAFEKIHRAYPNTSLRIGGNGDSTAIETFIEKYNLQNSITILPEMNHLEVADEMKNADAFVLYSYYENQPCVIIESFSVGTPVISSDVGGISEFFPEQYGILIEPANVDVLVNAMKEMIENTPVPHPEIMHQYIVDNFSQNAISESFDTIYNEVLAHD